MIPLERGGLNPISFGQEPEVRSQKSPSQGLLANNKQLMTKTLVDGIVNCGCEVTNFSAIWTQRAIEQNGN